MARERARETERPGLERERERVHVSEEGCVSIITKCMPPQLHSMICAAAADASQFLQAKFAGCLLSSRGKATFFFVDATFVDGAIRETNGSRTPNAYPEVR